MPQKSYQVTHTSQACLGEAQNRKWTESGLTVTRVLDIDVKIPHLDIS